jgi:co-chaperonin GroES (HSP10)
MKTKPVRGKSRAKVTTRKNTALSLPGSYASVRVKASDPLPTNASELKQKLADLCIDAYLGGGQRFIPLPPFVLVRVLPKDLVSDGGIILPNQQQNKPVHEGIVLETFRPYEEEVVLTTVARSSAGHEIRTEEIGIIHRECPLKRGQRIAYPYYEGVAHKYLGDDYVLIRHSADQIKYPYCQALGILDYEGDKKIGQQITALMRKYYSITTSGVAVSRGGDPTKSAR